MYVYERIVEERLETERHVNVRWISTDTIKRSKHRVFYMIKKLDIWKPLIENGEEISK